MAYQINPEKELSQPRRPLLLASFTFEDGAVYRAATVPCTFDGHAYAATIDKQVIDRLASLSEQGVDRVPSAAVTLVDTDGSLWSGLERAAGKGFKGAELILRFALFDPLTGEFSTDSFIPFVGDCDQPASDEKYLSISASSRLNLAKYALPCVRIAVRCPWLNPATAEQRALVLANPWSRFRFCGEARDLATAPPCGYVRQTCTQALRYGGLTLQLEKTGSGKEYVSGNWISFRNADTSGKFKEYWPLWLGGRAWMKCLAIQPIGDGNYTRSEVAVGVDAIEIEKVVVNGRELTQGTTGDFRWHYVNQGARDGSPNTDVPYNGNGDPYGNLTVIQVLMSNKYWSPDQEPDISILGYRKAIRVYRRIDSASASGGAVTLHFDANIGSGEFGDGSTVHVEGCSLGAANGTFTARFPSAPYNQCVLEGSSGSGTGTGGVLWYESRGWADNSLGGASTPWVLAEVLIWSRFNYEDLDVATFADAAKICNALVTYTDQDGNTGTQPRFSTALALRERRSVADIVRGLRQSIGGLLVPGQDGKIKLQIEGPLPEQQPAPVDGSNDNTPIAGQLRNGTVANGYAAYLFDDALGNYSGLKRIARPISESPNRVQFAFSDPASQCAVSDMSVADPYDVARIDQENPGGLQVSPEGVASQNHAFRVGRLGLAKIHRGNPVGDTRGTDWWEWQTTFRGCRLTIGQLVALTNVRYGLDKQILRITEIKPSQNYETVILRGHYHNDSWYADTGAELADAGVTPYPYEPPPNPDDVPPHVTPGTPVIARDGNTPTLRLPITYPDNRGTLKSLRARVQVPYAGDPSDTATNVPPAHVNLDLGPFSLDPELLLTLPADAWDQTIGLWVMSCSDTITRKYTEDGTPFLTVDIPALIVSGPKGAEWGPNPRRDSLVPSVETQIRSGAEQWFRANLRWAIPSEDSRIGLVRGWQVDLMDPRLSDDPGTGADERILASVRVSADRTVASLDWRRIEDSEPAYLLMVRPVDADGRLNQYVPTITAAIEIRPRIGTIIGAEKAGIVRNLRLAVDPYYEFDASTGQYWAVIEPQWSPPDNDRRYGGGIVIIHYNGKVWTAPGVHWDGATLRLPESPAAGVTWEGCTVHVLSQNANGELNTYQPDDANSTRAQTPYVEFTLVARHVAAPLENVTAASVAAAYSDPDANGKRTLLLTPTFTVPSDSSYAYVDFWAYRPDSLRWHLLGFPSRGGAVDVAIIEQLPAAAGNWVFKFIAHDVNGRDRDGKANSDPANPPAGTPSYTLSISPPAAGAAGTEYTSLVTGFTGGGAGGAAIEYRTNVDGVEQWRVALTWTRPAVTTFGGIRSVVRFDPSGSYWDVPLGYTGPDESLPWRCGWQDMGAAVAADIYAVSVAVAGQRENTIAPGTTPCITGLTISPQTVGSIQPKRFDRTKLAKELVIDGDVLRVGMLLFEQIWGDRARFGGSPAVTIASATNASPCVIQKNSHGLTGTPVLVFSGGTGNWAALNGAWPTTVVDADHIAIPMLDSTTWGAITGTIQYARSVPGLAEFLNATGELIGQIGKCEDPENPGNYYYGLDLTDGYVVVRNTSANRKLVLSGGQFAAHKLDDQANVYGIYDNIGFDVVYRVPDGMGGYSVDVIAQLKYVSDADGDRMALVFGSGGYELLEVSSLGVKIGGAWLTDAVLGKSNLTNVGTIPVVSATGTITEGPLSDDGSAKVIVTGRSLELDNARYVYCKDSAGTARSVIWLDAGNPDILHLRNNQRAAGGSIQFETLSGGGVGATLDNAGNFNAIGELQQGSVPVANSDLYASASSTLGPLTTSYQDVPGATVALNKSGTWLITASADVSVNNSDGLLEIELNVGGTGNAQTARAFVGGSASAWLGSLSKTWVIAGVDVSGGNVTAKLRAKSGTAANAYVNQTYTTITAVWLHA